MKFTQKTVQVLKNFASINSAIHFRKGEYISTVSKECTIIAKAKLDQTFEHSFAIFDLNRFLGALSLFNDPEIQFHDKYLTIKNDDRELNYIFTDPKSIQSAPENGIKVPDVAVELKLTASVISDITKALSIMSLPEVAFVGDGKTISVQAIDSNNPTTDVFKLTNLGKTDKTFKAIFKIENLKIVPADYDVTISREGVSHFTGQSIEYWIVVESKSEFV